MKTWIALTFLLLIGGGGDAATAAESRHSLRVMTFNVMCDFCSKGHDGTFAQRIAAVADTINRNEPDLISLQELRTGGQVDFLLEHLFVKYTPVFAGEFGLSYADPTLLVRKDRFEVVTKDGMWLGPTSPDFGFGWKTRFPRRIEFAVLREVASKEEMIFAGTHFDNNPANREPSADLLIEKFASSKIPVIFGGDTNLRPDRPGYARLAKEFRDTYVAVVNHPYHSNGATVPEDGCNLEKAPTFPECRIDHILLSKNSPWKVSSWSLDAFKYPVLGGFISDHRAVVVDLSR
jgi:endonuclease/exonuclease/phosphatase family metal-dependent hydrolase